MAYKAQRRRAKALQQIRKSKEAKKRQMLRKTKPFRVYKEYGHWHSTNPAEIHTAIINFLRTLTMKVVPNLAECKIVSKHQAHRSDLAFSGDHGHIGYQKIVIDGDIVLIEAMIDCRYSSHRYSVYPAWQESLANPNFFDRLAEFVGKICCEYFRMEYESGSKLYL